ncbi:AI-2E family transporter [Halorarum salinum]|uniref:AI-2E family transporter n=1 Tax=Halorarum salinum TaxID=2743089 RepID=A0A7D5QJR0_9EURY|nr:AI-2E family transporter [Halobaculum salinum]QLG61585.1 AI-2E family transporter [Halobaculum salinum]
MSLSEVDRGRAAWWAVGAALGAAVLYVVYSFVGTIVFGVFIYYATRPVYQRLRRRIPQPSVAAGVAIFALALPALLLMTYALLIVASEVSALVGNGVFDPTDVPGVDEDLIELLSNPEALLALDWSRYLNFGTLQGVFDSLGQAVDTIAFLGTALVHLFVMLALAFYLLRDGGRLGRYVVRYADSDGVLEAYGRAVDRDYNSIFFGNILNAIITGTIGVIVYSLLNVFAPEGGAIPAAALVGLLAGVASLIPIVGMKLVYVPVALYMAGRAVAFDETGALAFVLAFALVSFVVVDTIPDLVLRPYVSGRSLHVGTVMLAYTLGPLLFGWYGIFLMPMLLVFVVHFVRIVLPELVAGTEIKPYAVDPSYLTVGGPFVYGDVESDEE